MYWKNIWPTEYTKTSLNDEFPEKSKEAEVTTNPKS